MEFRLLGPMEAVRAGERLPLGGPKQRSLLAHLLIRANRVVDVGWLLDEVWGSEPPDAVIASLQAYVSRLRRLLGSGRIERQGAGYRINVETDELDTLRLESLVRGAQRLKATDPAAAVERLEEAFGLWRGHPMSDLLDGPGTALRSEAAHLAELRHRAVADWVGLGLALGKEAEIVDRLEAFLAEEPLREPAWGQLMLALYRSGRQADALATYHRARRILRDELGIDPSPELQRLHRQLLQQDPSLEVRGLPLRGYRLLEQIGEGVFGVVHRAIQPGVGREVALKAIHPRLADHPEFIRRFESEAQLVARLEHPRIVPLYDYWRDADGAYLVMRRLRGGSLRDALADRPLQPEAAARVLDQVAAALAVAHAQGIVHRDVKPANVLLDEEGDAYLSDFGIATELAAAEARARNGSSDVTAYLSPEELRGEPVSARTDVYALGVVLFEMLTGIRPGAAVGRDGAPSGLAGPAEQVLTKAMAPDPGDRYAGVEAMAAAFRDALGEPAALVRPAAERGAAASNPYKGLRPFEEADAADFFGRDDMVRRLVGRLSGSRGRFLAVVGPSGSGKSSLVRAGLVPALRDGAVPGSERWFIADLFPGRAPFEELASALGRVGIGVPSRIADDERGLLEAVDAALSDAEAELLLVVDQFEEVFTLVESEAIRRRLLAAIRRAVTDPGSRLRVVVTLRADFYDRPLAYRGFAELLREATETVVPLSAEELERAVTGPARRAGTAPEPGLVGRIVADVGEEPGGLPLLQYALTELFDRRSGDALDLATYRGIGGISGALARRADELFDELTGAERAAARQLLLRLVTLGEGSHDTRRRVRRAELELLEVEPAALDAVIARFARHRLLSLDRDAETREPTVEVAHEALIRAWPRLRQWIEEAREDLRAERRLAQAAEEWERSGRERSYLLTGSRLDQVEAWSGGTQLALTAAERELLEASRAERDARIAEERRSVRRLRALVAVLGASVVIAGGLAAFAFDQQARAEREARAASARELAAAARAYLSTDPDLAILLAAEAVETTSRTDGLVLREAEEALHAAVLSSRIVAREPPAPSVWYSDALDYRAVAEGERLVIRDAASDAELATLPATDLVRFAISPDLRLAALVGADRRLSVWGLEGGDVIFAPAATVDAVTFSPDGTRLAALTSDGAAVVWSLPAGEEVGRVQVAGADAPSGGGVALAWTPHSGRLAVPGGSETVVVDVESGEVVHRLPGDGRSVALGPDGALLLTTGQDSATLWDAHSGEPRYTLSGIAGFVNAATFSRDGRLAATGSHDGMARVWEVETGELLIALPGMGVSVDRLAFGPDGTRLVGWGSTGLLIWDVTSVGSREMLGIAAHAPPGIPNVTYSPDGRRLATAGFDGAARIWEAASGELLAELAGHEGGVTDIAFSPDGTMLATSSFDLAVRLWDASGHLLRTLQGHEQAVWSVAFSPDRARLVTASEDGTVRIWDVASGGLAGEFTGHRDYVYDAAWSPAGSPIVSVSNDFTARVWDPQTGDELTPPLAHDENVVEQAFSPDGERVATASFDGTARVWEVDTGAELLRLEGHGGIVLDVESSPDGSRWATASLDGTVRLWDAETGGEMLTLAGQPAGVLRLAFSPDGRRLAAAGGDGTVRVYALDLGELLDLARSRASRPLTDAECRQYLHLEACPAG